MPYEIEELEKLVAEGKRLEAEGYPVQSVNAINIAMLEMLRRNAGIEEWWYVE